MIHENIATLLRKRRSTLLGVGPMSLNCVDAAVELANEYEVLIPLIASRRQIDADEFGGGYVNQWTTEEFASYVTKKDKKGKILLARDHGGPWQSDLERKQNLGLRDAMESAKHSYKADIKAGFKILHIDPSIDIHGRPDIDEVLDRIFELYEYCWGEAQKVNSEIIFEIGTEEQTGSTNSQEELDYTLNSMFRFCKKYHLPNPSFVVIQSGTKVMEMRNVGSFDSPVRVSEEIPSEIQLPKMIEICNRYGIFMKEHNTDYLSDEALQWHPRMGIHAANVAPEFGVCESRALVNILSDYGLNDLVDKFLSLSYESKKWEKWMLPETKASDREKALIAGHYNFSEPKFLDLKMDVRKQLSSKGINLDEYLKNKIKECIFRYLKQFRLVELM